MRILFRRSIIFGIIAILGLFAQSVAAQVVILEADINITSSKIAPNPEPAIAGSGADNIDYLFTVTNDGPDDATNLTVDVTPATTVAGIVCADPVVSVGAVAGGVWTIGSLVAANFVTLDQKCTADAASDPGNYSMTIDNPSLDQVETGAGANTASENSTVIRESNLATTKSASPDPLVAQGSELTYTITVLNNGPSEADNVQILDNLPAGFSHISNDGGCNISQLPLIVCDLGTLADGGSGTVNIVGTVIADLGDFLSNTATARSASNPGSAGEESDTVRSEVVVGVPSDGTAIVGVRKVFNDGNNETPVTVTLECLSGTYAPDFAILQPGGDMQHLFVVDAIPSGTANPCTVVEAPVDGYSPYYICEPDDSTSEVDGTLCESFEKPKAVAEKFGIGMLGNDTTACGWIDVQPGDSNVCYILNVPDPVDVDVTKVWDLTAAGRNDVDTDVRLTLNCDARIKDGEPLRNGRWVRSIYLGDSDYLDEDGDDQGFGVAMYEVFPEWYPTADDPDNQRYTSCRVEENASNDDAVLVDNGCLDIELAAGMGDECTITNTVFYEGIPTLNQYGMAIMALLMLGMGLVGFRRFV